MGESLGIGGKLILAFITLLLGAVLVAQVATTSIAVTALTGISSETVAFIPVNSSEVDPAEVLTLAQAPTGWKATDCPISDFVLTNSSGTAYVLTTDYVPNLAAGTWTLKNTAVVNQSLYADNITLADYHYCGDDYMNLSWGRTGINLVAGFFAIAILMISLGLFYSVAKETGMF